MLVQRGHSVTFAGRHEMIGRVSAAGLEAREITSAYALIDRFAWHPLPRIFGYLSSPAVGEELISIVGREKPDAVIIDGMFTAALNVSSHFGIPTAVVVNTFFHRIFGAWRANLERQSAGRVRAGFAPLPPVDVLWGARDLIQVNTRAAFDAPEAVPWTQVRHGGPVLDEGVAMADTALALNPGDPVPLVLVSFSTVEEQRSPAMLQRTLDALAPLPIHIVATLGDVVDPSELALPPNAVVFRSASHDLLMKHAALVVTHGGHGTAMRSLRHGLPMICIPALAEDQHFIAAWIAECGAGRALAPDCAIDDIRLAARAVLGDPGYRAAAVRLSAQLAIDDGASSAADNLERLSSRAQAPARINPLWAKAGA